MHGGIDEDPAGGSAVLTGVAEAGEDDAGGDGVEVRVGEDEDRRLATELEVHPFERRHRGGRHRLPGAHAAGDRHQVDVGVGGDRGADDGTVTGHNIQNACREDVGHELGETKRGQRSLLGRLEDTGVTGREDRPELPGRHQERVVPRRDRADNTDRLTHDGRGAPLDVLPRCEGGLRADGTCHEPEGVDGGSDVVGREPARLARVAGLELGELGRVLLDDTGDREESVGPVLGGTPAPVGGSAPCRGDCTVDVGGGAPASTRNQLLGRGVDDVLRGGPVALPCLAVDDVRQRRRHDGSAP